MTRIFISYNRQSESITRILAEDIKTLGKKVWFDRELSGGQAWWDQILTQIRNCDLFVFVLTPESLNSQACKREYSYACDLGKPILPILVAEGVTMNFLPPALLQIQFVDYRQQDRNDVLRLARAFATIPAPKPIPNPLPTPPQAPISYLGSLTERIETTDNLSYENQSSLLLDLKRSVREPDNTSDALTLLKRLRKRRDLFAVIAEEIDAILNISRTAIPAEPSTQTVPNYKAISVKTSPNTRRNSSKANNTQPPTLEPSQTPRRRKITRRERVIGSVWGAFLGTGVGIIAMCTYAPDQAWFAGLITGAGGAISGAISGTQRRLIIAALSGAVFGCIIGCIIVALLASSFINVDSEEFFSIVVVLGAPPGAILGTIIGVILRNRQK